MYKQGIEINTWLTDVHVKHFEHRTHLCAVMQNWCNEINKWLGGKVGVLAIDSGSKEQINSRLCEGGKVVSHTRMQHTHTHTHMTCMHAHNKSACTLRHNQVTSCVNTAVAFPLLS